MKASDLIAEKISQYTDFVFSGQGGSVVHILDSLYKRDDVKLIPSQNEQGASLAADAYTRTSGKLGVVVTTSGPGTINALQGLACSYYDSVPALYFSGAPVTGNIKKNKDLRQLGFQEMEIEKIVKSFSKYSIRIKNVNDIIYEIEKCAYIAKSGRPGPCVIDLPDDIQRMDTELKDQKKFIPQNDELTLDLQKVDRAQKMIEQSKRPIFVIGNGVKISNSKKNIDKLLEKTNIPFAPTWATFDMFKSNDPKNVGSFGVYATRYGNFSIYNSDLLIILGSQLNPSLIGSNAKFFAPNAKKILVDIDEAQLNEENNVKIDLKINCDVKNFINELNKREIKWKSNNLWFKKIKELKKKISYNSRRIF